MKPKRGLRPMHPGELLREEILPALGKSKTEIAGLYLNCGWNYGGFKATPAAGFCFAHLIARDEAHPAAAAYRIDRFASGRVIDEKGAGAQPNLH